MLSFRFRSATILLAVGVYGQAPNTSAKIEDAPVLVGAGDIASCDDLAGAQATAKLIDRIPGTVFQ
jgi:hypothetical protein